MIEGKIDGGYKPVVLVRIMSREGEYHPFNVVLDTGFNGDLVLPPAAIQRLGLVQAVVFKATLANGQEVYLDGFETTALWHNRPRRLIVLEPGNEALLGMNLLAGSRVTLDVEADGAVVIEEASGN